MCVYGWDVIYVTYSKLKFIYFPHYLLLLRYDEFTILQVTITLESEALPSPASS